MFIVGKRLANLCIKLIKPTNCVLKLLAYLGFFARNFSFWFPHFPFTVLRIDLTRLNKYPPVINILSFSRLLHLRVKDAMSRESELLPL